MSSAPHKKPNPQKEGNGKGSKKCKANSWLRKYSVMEALLVLGSSAPASASLIPSPLISNHHRNPYFCPRVLPCNSLLASRVQSSLSCMSKSASDRPGIFFSDGYHMRRFFLHITWRLSERSTSELQNVIKNRRFLKRRKVSFSLCNISKCSENLKKYVPVLFTQLLVGVMLVTSVTVSSSRAPSWALSEENRLFLEAWRTIDRAYVDKTFNGQSWFRYRENALRNEPMNTREQTYLAIKKMLSTLDDPFTRFLEPEKFKSLRSGTQSALTGVGLSIGYPTGNDGSPSGLVVISSTPGGPANKAGILSGDIILAIDDTNTESMGIYDAADRLQGPEGSVVELMVRSGSKIRHLSLIREKVSLNPVKSRICEASGSGKDTPRIGYVKLTSFNKNASGAVKEAIETLRERNVNAFVLDLRDNSGGLFPEGIEIAKICFQTKHGFALRHGIVCFMPNMELELDKGVIVYISDSKGVRDIYDTDGSNAIATSEPLAVLVNKGTASASEILAGALKDNKRAVLLGEPTFGKGKIQSVFELSDGSGLAVTVARYETPAHNDIDKVGIVPDHPLPASFPKDDEGFCGCLQDSMSACHLDRVELFSK